MRLFLGGFLALIILVGLGSIWMIERGIPEALAANPLSCSIQDQNTLLNQFSDNAPPGSIRPVSIRNIICTMFNLAGGSGFPFSLGSTSIAAHSTNPSITGVGLVNPTISGTASGSPTYTGVPKYTGLASGTPVACLGLDSGNNLITTPASGGVCGGGGGGGGAPITGGGGGFTGGGGSLTGG